MEQILPYSEIAEQAVLSAAFINPGAISEIDLSPDDFYIAGNRYVWQVLTTLTARGIDPDYVTVINTLQKADRLQEIGGEKFILDMLWGEGVISVNALNYARIVKDYGRRRRAIRAASELAKAAFDLKGNFDAKISEVVRSITMDVAPGKGAVHVGELIDTFFDEVQELIKSPRPDVWGLKTLIADYDTTTGGLQDKDGELVYIAGEPAVGKSILAAQIALNLATQGEPGAIYSLEMKNKQILRRTISAMMRVETRKLKTGNLSEKEIQLFIEKCQTLAGLNLFICDESSLTTAELRADIARLKVRRGIRWFVLDYLYLMEDAPGSKPKNDTERTEALSRQVKQICKDYEVCGLTINSITKDGMDGGALGKKNMRGSGQVIHDADTILFMMEHQPEYGQVKNKNLVTCAFGKGRELDKANKAFDLFKHDGYPLFENVSKGMKP